MVWPMVAAMAVSTLVSAKTSADNADNMQASSALNAQIQGVQGQQTAMASLMTASANSKRLMDQAIYNSVVNVDIARYNSDLLDQVANYNSLLYQAEIDSIYEAAELDLYVNEVVSAKARGTAIAQQSASGTLINEGSNAAVITEIRFREELNKVITRTNADKQATSLLNAAAQGEWQAKMEGAKQVYTARVNGTMGMMEAAMNGEAMMFDAKVNANTSLTNASNRASEIVNTGNMRADNMNNQAIGTLLSGAANTTAAYYKAT